MLEKDMRRPRLNPVTFSLSIYLFYLGCLTLAPFDFSMAAIAERTWIVGNRSISDFAFNLLGFVPFGFILFFLTKRDSKNLTPKWVFTTGAAAILSLSLETAQMFLLTRVPSLVDLLANTLGGGLGFWLAHHLAQGWIVHLKSYRRKLVFSVLTLYVGGLVSLFLWAATSQKLEGWDPSYPFLIGNEATLDRPWLGKIFFLALYDRVLTADEIKPQFQVGPHVEAEFYLEGAPIALYAFQEAGGTRVHDLSPVGPPLNLEIADPQKAIWLPTGGLELTAPTLLRSSVRPQKLYQRFTAADRFSVVSWFEPKDALQAGPARIVSLSLNPSLRNFTLGQKKSEIHFRVRNPVAGPNGTRLDLRTKGLGLRPRPTHVVAIYDRGMEQLYVNGVLFDSIVPWDGLTLIARILNFDTASHWQRGLLVLLLIGPLAAGWVLSKKSNDS